jgi:death-on-curing protein
VTPVFLEADAVLFLHDQAVREFGGLHGVKDQALLDSALQRPRNRLEQFPIEWNHSIGILALETMIYRARDPPNRTDRALAYAGEPPPDLFDLAAAYAFGIGGNHPFQDGNKRTGWASCVLFLRVNGVRPRIPALLVVPRMLALASGAMREADFAAWLREACSTAP